LSHEEHDVRNKANAMRFLVDSQERGEFLTGLMYINTERPDFVSIQEMCETPLAHLSDADLRPGPEVLKEIMAGI
jgi:2-oxoglutarate ferredoxin oxidoreductase subunit beta